MKKIKMHAITSPAMAPGCNDDEKVLLSCGKGVPEDVVRDAVNEDGGVEEASDTKEVGTWDNRVLVMATAVVDFNGVLAILSDGMIIEYEGIDVEIRGRTSTTVTVVIVGVLVIISSSTTRASS